MVGLFGFGRRGHAVMGGMNMLSPANPIRGGEKIDIRCPE